MAMRSRKMPILKDSPALEAAEERRRALMCILRERRRLLAEACTSRDVNPDPVDTARELEEERVWLAVLDHSHEMQWQVEEVRRLLAEGRYGQCLDCGKPIPAGRLRALPFALRCLLCQERCEKQESDPERRTPRWGRMPWDEASDGTEES